MISLFNSGVLIRLMIVDVFFSISAAFVLRVALLATTIRNYFYQMLFSFNETFKLQFLTVSEVHSYPDKHLRPFCENSSYFAKSSIRILNTPAVALVATITFLMNKTTLNFSTVMMN